MDMVPPLLASEPSEASVVFAVVGFCVVVALLAFLVVAAMVPRRKASGSVRVSVANVNLGGRFGNAFEFVSTEPEWRRRYEKMVPIFDETFRGRTWREIYGTLDLEQDLATTARPSALRGDPTFWFDEEGDEEAYLRSYGGGADLKYLDLMCELALVRAFRDRADFDAFEKTYCPHVTRDADAWREKLKRIFKHLRGIDFIAVEEAVNRGVMDTTLLDVAGPDYACVFKRDAEMALLFRAPEAKAKTKTSSEQQQRVIELTLDDNVYVAKDGTTSKLALPDRDPFSEDDVPEDDDDDDDDLDFFREEEDDDDDDEEGTEDDDDEVLCDDDEERKEKPNPLCRKKKTTTKKKTTPTTPTPTPLKKKKKERPFSCREGSRGGSPMAAAEKRKALKSMTTTRKKTICVDVGEFAVVGVHAREHKGCAKWLARYFKDVAEALKKPVVILSDTNVEKAGDDAEFRRALAELDLAEPLPVLDTTFKERTIFQAQSAKASLPPSPRPFADAPDTIHGLYEADLTGRREKEEEETRLRQGQAQAPRQRSNFVRAPKDRIIYSPKDRCALVSRSLVPASFQGKNNALLRLPTPEWPSDHVACTANFIIQPENDFDTTTAFNTDKRTPAFFTTFVD